MIKMPIIMLNQDLIILQMLILQMIMHQIKFINYTQQYCIGIIDIVNSTNETSKISSPLKLRKYYSLFLNTMSSVINNCNGRVIKNIGDSLFFYFPKTCDETNEPPFMKYLNVE